MTPIDLTEEQHLAVEHVGSNVIVRAGAGTGKTRVLVARYMEILNKSLARVPEIVAITFTRKAAKEMRDRIRLQFPDTLVGAGSLNELESAPISTIHSFCQRILRENATVIGIDPDFRVLEEIEEVIFREAGIQNAVMNSIHCGRAGMIRLIGEFGLDTLIEQFRYLYAHRSRMGEWMGQPSVRMEDRPKVLSLAEWIKLRIEAELNDPAVARSVETLRERRARDPVDRIEIAREEALRIIHELRGGFSEAEARSLLEEMEKIQLTGGVSSAWGENDFKAVKDTIKQIRSAFKEVKKETRPMADEKEKTIEDLLGILVLEYSHVESALAKRKSEENLLDYDDLLILTRNALQEHPEIRKRLQRKYRYYLVDEFQDTDSRQWEILRFLAAGGDGASGDRLFLVGDYGQSIYRFRGAEAGVFEKAGEKIRKKGGRDFPLTINFRSTPSILRFVNHLQGKMYWDRSPLAPVQKPISLRGNRPEETCGLPVEVLIVRGERGTEKEDLRKSEAEAVVAKIGEIVREESRDHGDIAMLFRSMSFVWIYELALRNAGIPYTLLKGGRYFGLQEVRDIMNALKAIDDEGDEVALAGLLRSPLFAVSDNTIHWLCTGSRLPDGLRVWRGKGGIPPEEGEVLEEAIDFLREARVRKDSSDIYGLIAWIVERRNFQEVLKETFAGERRVLNINKLLQLSLAFESKGLFTLGDFIRYADRVAVRELHEGEAPVEPDEAGVVKVMTIHGAKGLEFPVVFLPDLSWYRRSESPLLASHPIHGFALRGRGGAGEGEVPWRYHAISFVNAEEESMESQRLFYVAMTRARDKLVLSTSWSESTSGQSLELSWFRWIKDLLSNEAPGGHGEPPVSNDPDRIRDLCKVTIVSAAEREMRKKTVSGGQLPRGVDDGSGPGISAGISVRIGPVEPARHSKERSVTQILDYLECTRLFYLRHELKVPEIEPILSGRPNRTGGPATGDIAHRVLELWDFSSEEELIRLVREQVRSERGPENKEEEDRILRLFGPLRSSSLFHQMVKAKEEGILYRELHFTVVVRGVPIIGSIDALFRDGNGGWVILDYKAIATDEQGSLEDSIRFRRQLSLYAMAVESLQGEPPAKGIVYFLPTGYAVELGTADLKAHESMIQAALDGIETNLFHGEEGCCDGCRMKPYCRPYSGNDVDREGMGS